MTHAASLGNGKNFCFLPFTLQSIYIYILCNVNGKKQKFLPFLRDANRANNIPLLVSVDAVPLMKTAGVVENY